MKVHFSLLLTLNELYRLGSKVCLLTIKEILLRTNNEKYQPEKAKQYWNRLALKLKTLK